MNEAHYDSPGGTNHPPPDSHGARPVLVAWARDIAISLAVSIFFIIFLYQPVKWKAPA